MRNQSSNVMAVGFKQMKKKVKIFTDYLENTFQPYIPTNFVLQGHIQICQNIK